MRISSTFVLSHPGEHERNSLIADFPFLDFPLSSTRVVPRVSLEVLPDGTPKLPSDSQDDGRPKLFVSRDALLKVLGCTVDIGEDMTPILRDKEGNVMDPNA